MDILLTEKLPEEKSKPASTFLDVELVSEPNLITDHLGIFTFKPKIDTESFPDFSPGKYITLCVSREGLVDEVIDPKEVKKIQGKEVVPRPYSVASPPENKNIELYIAWIKGKGDGRRKTGEGVLSTELFDPQPDTELMLIRGGKAQGKFLLPEDSRDVIMVATGTGIAPYMSMLRSDKINHVDRKYILIHGVGYAADMAYRAELNELGKIRDLTSLWSISQENLNDHPEKYVQEFFFNRGGQSGIMKEEELKDIRKEQIYNTRLEEILEKELTPENSLVMLCGHPNMIESMELIAEAKGYKPGIDLITEEYW